MNDKQRWYLNEARQSLDAAQALLERGHFGYAASRAYYAMFYTASALLEGQGLRFSKHSAVTAAFGQHFVRTGRVAPEYHRMLHKAVDLREIGDYGPFNTISTEEAQEQIERAARFVAMGEGLI